MDQITSTKMLQMAQVLQQLPSGIGDVPVRQLEQAREKFQSIDSVPPPEATPLLQTPAQHVDTYA